MSKAFERVGSLISVWQRKRCVGLAAQSIARKEGIRRDSAAYRQLCAELHAVVAGAEQVYGLDVQEA